MKSGESRPCNYQATTYVWTVECGVGDNAGGAVLSLDLALMLGEQLAALLGRALDDFVAASQKKKKKERKKKEEEEEEKKK